MQQRRSKKSSLDDFPTQPWGTRALCEWLIAEGYNLSHCSCREPAANRGYMTRPLSEYFRHVEASDVHDYGVGFPVRDYLSTDLHLPDTEWTITNPPYKIAEHFIQRALATSTKGVAVLVRIAFLEGTRRYSRLYCSRPPTFICQFSERLPMFEGRVDPTGSTATAYCWLIWDKERKATRPTFDWIKPCRARLEYQGDYNPPMQYPRSA